MMRKKIVTALFLIFAIPAFLSRNTYAQIVECDKDQKFVKGSTWCPCPEDESLASICGVVKSSRLDNMLPGDSSIGAVAADPVITKSPVGGVTVSIYENVEGIGTGQPFGNLENKLVECVTSENEGKYVCPVRRLNPGNMAYVVFSCNGRVADIKIIPTVKSIIGLDSDVNCLGDLEYTPTPETLKYANRDQFLGCKSEPTKPSEHVEYEEEEYTYHSTQIGEIDGDRRFTPNNTWLNWFEHPGARWEEDCVTWYEQNGDLSYEYFPSYLAFLGPNDFRSAKEKCDYGGYSMDIWDKLTTPFRYDIPDSREEPTFRVWETRTTMQRELQDPRAYQQFNHLMFGDCLDKAELRFYGQPENDEPISCRALFTCMDVGGTKRNVHTTHSFGSRLSSPITWEVLIEAEERNSEELVCNDIEGDYAEFDNNGDGYINIAEATEHGGCGTGGLCIPPQYLLIAEGVTKTKTHEDFTDAYAASGDRGEVFEPKETAAKQPHRTGNYINFECPATGKNNCGMTSIRISSNEIKDVESEDEKGALTDRYRGHIDVHADYYDDSYEATYYDVGGDVQSLCNISSVQDLLLINDDTNAKVNNFFKGDKDSHLESEVAGTATYATAAGKIRDLALASSAHTKTAANAKYRDAYDSLLRYASGKGSLDDNWWSELVAAYNSVITFVDAWGDWETGTTVKSFANRVAPDTWNELRDAPITTTFCISESDFSCGEEGGCTFPPYVEGVDGNGYPGSAPGCYPWNDIIRGDYCDVYPGREFDGTTGEFNGKLRTCKINECARFRLARVCTREECSEYACYEAPPDLPPDDVIACNIENYCPADHCRGECIDTDCVSTRIDVRRIPCSPVDETTCLKSQEDTWRPSESDLRELGDDILEPLNSGRYRPEVVGPYCDLSRAGPMIDPGDIGTAEGFTYGDMVVQRQIGGDDTHYHKADSILKSGNDTISRWSSPVTTRVLREKAAFNDTATTNEIDQNNVGATTHKTTAGALVRGEGFGGTSTMLDIVANPLVSSSFNEKFAECNLSTGENYCWGECDPFDPVDVDPSTDGVQHTWCYKIDPPGEVDLDTIDGGICKPNLTGSCPLVGEGVGELAQEILGAAGMNAGGTPGSVMLAAIVGETGWLYYPIGASSYKMSWDNSNISFYSYPWYARMPGCRDVLPVAQGPFGLIDTWFNNAVRDGGYHPNRADSGEDALKVVSKCNFIDAAYASAHMLKHSGYDCSTDLDTNAVRDMIKQKLAGYRGTDVNKDKALDGLVDIAVYCQ